MDKETRNLVFNTTQAIRRLLEEEFSLQLEGTFDVHADGRIAGQPGSQLSAAERLVRCRIVEAIQHRLAVGESAAEAVRGFQSEGVFTFLNRLAALKMMEARALVLPCVSQGDQSQGFKEFSGLAPGLIELPDKGYRLYLECLFDEIGREVGVLFDRTDAASQLWPRRKALEAALAKLNTPELAGVWAEDETIGWIYQYYNDPQERKQMREESSAPRNSRELAVRNQFFTPRYVVEFLTDNTLGRIWYEMTKGQTRLKDQCRYLVRRPNEIFLTEGQASPTLPPTADNCSQEDLLRQPVHIPHRHLKDPREIRMIDPACGSMHFGLYAFDLFSVIYDEAWEMAHGLDAATKSAGTFTPFVTFVASFADNASFLREVPRLIVEHNIHGIDIDPRAAQIAGLALWLRAQRGWQVLGLKSSDRPPIRRSNIVCAEPMPGERGLLREFVDRHFPEGERSLFQSFLENVWDKMRLAGEAGSLLKIEEEIRSAIEDARDAWGKFATKPLELFTTTELNQLSTAPELTGLEQAVSCLTTDPRPMTTDFWERIEERIYAALRDYAEQAENGGGFQRRLFAEDAARGFAFIDVCRNRYDVVLMNPPFGEPSVPSKEYIDVRFVNTKGDMYKTFVERFQEKLQPSSFLGIISSRKGFFEGQSLDWREQVLLQRYSPALLVDLGGGVLDAMVETAAYVLRSLSETEQIHLLELLADHATKVAVDLDGCFPVSRYAEQRGLRKNQVEKEIRELLAAGYISELQDSSARFHCLKTPKLKNEHAAQGSASELICFRLIEHQDKAKRLAELIIAPNDSECFAVQPQLFRSFPNTSFAYWIGSSLRKLFTVLPSFEGNGRRVRVGLQTSDDFRFIRASWEVVTERILNPKSWNAKLAEKTTFQDWCINETSKCVLWAAFAKGGEYSPYYDDIHLLLNWANDGKELKAFACQVDGNSTWSRNIRSVDTYFLPGLTWPQRSQIGLNVRAKPAGTIHALMGSSAFVEDVTRLPVLLGLLNSSTFRFLVELSTSFGSYTEGAVKRTVTPNKIGNLPLEQKAKAAVLEALNNFFTDETAHSFYLPSLLCHSRHGIKAAIKPCQDDYTAHVDRQTRLQQDIDEIAFEMYGVGEPKDRKAINDFLGIVQAENNPTDGQIILVGSDSLRAIQTDLIVKQAVAYLLGCAIGRWDIRYATGEQAAPELPDPFAPLPVCPPGQLQNAQGLPARPEDVPAAYPVRIPWDGILVDDPNHPLDLERRVREVIEIIWSGKEGGPTAEAIEHEACEILGVKSLRDYFRKPAGFFAVWLYYHRLTPDTLFTVLRDHVKPKLEYEERQAFQLRQEAGTTPSTSQRRDIAEAEELVEDLRAFKAELDRVAPLFRPDLNDGVIINHAPLWRMIGLPKWRKDCQATWNELAKGNYDWAHLALHLWPERVIPKCATDRSLAIAHGLDAIFWREDPEKQGKWIARKVTELELRGLIAERTSAAVKAAVESLVGATSNEGAPRRGRKGAKA